MNVAALRAKSVLTFALHQVVGTWGIASFAAFGLFGLLDVMPDSVALNRSIRFVHWLLTENPFYPVQILTGVYLGWWLGRGFQHKSMLWIWVIPFAVLSYAVTVGLTVFPEWSSVLERPVTVGARLSHYFGWGCRPRTRCLDQLLITLPAYSSAAYSLGALLARRTRQQPEQSPTGA